MIAIQQLQNMPVFGGMSAQSMECLLEQSDLLRIDADRQIFSEGEIADAFYVVLSGRVEVVQLRERAKHLKTLRPGDCFGEMGLIDHQPRSATVRTLESAQILKVPLEAIFALYQHDMKQHTLLQMNMAREVSRRLRIADEKLSRRPDGGVPAVFETS